MLEQIHKIVWGPWLMALFLAVGAVYTVRSRGFQIRGFWVWWRATAGSLFSGRADRGLPEELPRRADGRPVVRASRREQLKTACTALAATVGTGNIIGVATAVMAGGPGALFWMWASAALGMMTAYGEVYLGIVSRYRQEDGRYICGPFVYLERMAGKPCLALLYALLCLLCSLGMGSMVQANSLTETVAYSFHVPKLAIALGLGFLTAWVIRGGRRKIGQVAAGLVPVSAGLYILFSVLVIGLCREELPGVIKDIFQEAFRLRSAVGGAAGFGVWQALRYGLARGVFSNEAGLGSLAVLHGDSPGTDPALQGMWAMFEVFFDTIVVCTLTGLAILCGLKGAGADPELRGAALTAWCFGRYLGSAGGYVLALSLVLFAFATIIAWYYLGSQALAYVEGWRREGAGKFQRSEREGAGESQGSGREGAGRVQRSGREGAGGQLGMDSRESSIAHDVYRLFYLTAVAAGCLVEMGKVWLLSDILNGLMALPNLAALCLLAGQVHFPKRGGDDGAQG